MLRKMEILHRCVGCCGAQGSGVCHVGEDEGEMEFDGDAFARLLRRVSLKEARQFTQLSYLGRMAYSIPMIKPANLLKCHGLRFVTSSLEKKQKLPNIKKVQSAVQDQERQQQKNEEGFEKVERQKKSGHLISASSAYRVAASAASYLYSQTRSILPFRSPRPELGLSLTAAVSGDGDEDKGLTSSEVASFVVTTNSVTVVVAAKEETKQAVAKNLNSAKSSPCEWFICDDDDTSETRFFVIELTLKGSESLASWQANLLLEPVQFEGLDVIVVGIGRDRPQRYL